MTLARRIMDSMASLFAYAMAPDDFSHAERLEVIRQGREGMEAAADLLALEDAASIANPPSDSQPDGK
jgi:hypothetical protein